TGQMWVPTATGRSFPVTEGKTASKAGPVVLTVRAPGFPEGDKETTRTARARLLLYYENNLLQSAAVRVGVVRAKVAEVRVSWEAIADRAYAKYVDRGYSQGDDLKDWLDAEQEVLAEARLVL